MTSAKWRAHILHSSVCKLFNYLVVFFNIRHDAMRILVERWVLRNFQRFLHSVYSYTNELSLKVVLSKRSKLSSDLNGEYVNSVVV